MPPNVALRLEAVFPDLIVHIQPAFFDPLTWVGESYPSELDACGLEVHVKFSTMVARPFLVLRSAGLWTISGRMAKVALFIPCFVDQLTPEVGLDMVRVLRRLGFEMEFPEAQTCCGQPAFNTGYWSDARPVAERFLQIFRNAEQVVCPSGSCTTMVRNFYPELLAGTPWHEEALKVGQRVFEFSEFLVKVAKVTDVGASFPHRVAVHDSCHALRELHLKQESRELLRHVNGLELVEMPYSEDCCGFGGTFATKFGAISAAMGDAKAGYAESSGVEYVTATDPSCLLHIDGILRRRNSKVRTIHLAGILAQTATAAQRRTRAAGAESIK